MRILLALIVILTLGLGGWWIWQDGRLAQDVPAPDAPVAADTNAVPPAATQATEAAADAAADAAAIAADVAAEAVEASEEAGVAPVSDAAAEAEAAAEAALEAADRAADAAATAASGAVAPVAQAVQDAAQAANDAAAATDQAATAAVAATRIQSLLTPEGFDAAQVARIIDDAALGDAQKATLKRLVETAGSNPDLLRQALDQVKAVMP
jgi:hypothetical protein